VACRDHFVACRDHFMPFIHASYLNFKKIRSEECFIIATKNSCNIFIFDILNQVDDIISSLMERGLL